MPERENMLLEFDEVRPAKWTSLCSGFLLSISPATEAQRFIAICVCIK